MQLTDEILSYIESHRQEAFDLLVSLAQIPAPPNQEQQRAEFSADGSRRTGQRASM